MPTSAMAVDFRNGTPVVVPAGGFAHPSLYFLSSGTVHPGVQEYK
ncbi:hypothetical protein [Streptacidiphilus sp. MAP5-3]